MNYFNSLIISLCASFGIGCSGGGESVTPPPPIVYPAAGTVLETSCDGTTLVQTIANGSGGSDQQRTEQSAQCGYVPPVNPPYGTLLREGCSQEYPGVKWFQYADGEGGTYDEKDTRSVECGWEPPVLSLSLEENNGDRFKPVRILVDYVDFYGNEEPWGMVHASTTLGRMQRQGNSILVYGEGAVGEGILTLGGEEIQFTIQEEPRCESNGIAYPTLDCQGYAYKGPSYGYIYYGDEDDQIVEWELGYFVYENKVSGTYDSLAGNHTGVTELFEVGSDEWNAAQSKVDEYNERYARSGIHVRYVLKYGNVGKVHHHGNGDFERIARTEFNADVAIALGYTCPETCGCAYVKTVFRENSNWTPVGLSACGTDTDLHELGHSFGLAHGPENRAYAAYGYIWPDFGHGWDAVCGPYYPDIMSYEPGDIGHHNSMLTCGEMYADNPNIFKYGFEEDPAGHRDYADAAYHINRIRYDVSLINCEDGKCNASPALETIDEPDPEQDILIEDWIEDIPNGRERYNTFMREMQREYKVENDGIRRHID